MTIEIVTMQDCASNYGIFEVIGSTGNLYIVQLNGSEGPGYCECKAFEFSQDQSCKHLRQVWGHACLYNPQWRPAMIQPKIRPVGYTYERFSEQRCACGDRMVYVRRAV